MSWGNRPKKSFGAVLVGFSAPRVLCGLRVSICFPNNPHYRKRFLTIAGKIFLVYPEYKETNCIIRCRAAGVSADQQQTWRACDAKKPCMAVPWLLGSHWNWTLDNEGGVRCGFVLSFAPPFSKERIEHSIHCFCANDCAFLYKKNLHQEDLILIFSTDLTEPETQKVPTPFLVGIYWIY